MYNHSGERKKSDLVHLRPGKAIKPSSSSSSPRQGRVASDGIIEKYSLSLRATNIRFETNYLNNSEIYQSKEEDHIIFFNRGVGLNS